MSVLMIFASCSMDTSYDDSNEIEEKTNTEKQDDSENNEDEPSKDEPSKDEPSKDEPSKDEPSKDEPSKDEPKTCEIDEDTKILGLNYFVCIDNSQIKLSPSINDENEAKKVSFFIRVYADCVSKYVEIRVEYNNKKLKFSSDSYIITDVMKKDSTINITIK